jgi:hypothetical protein
MNKLFYAKKELGVRILSYYAYVFRMSYAMK